MTPPRFFVDTPLAPASELALPPGPARHVQVLRLQPGQPIVLFNGQGGHWLAHIVHMGRKAVTVAVQAHDPVERELQPKVHLAVGLFALDRMDWLVEKATEMGAASLTPIRAERSNVAAARAGKRRERWRALSARACEQCGRNRLLQVHESTALPDFLRQPLAARRWLLAPSATPVPAPAYDQPLLPATTDLVLLSGPEGGFTAAETESAQAAGFQAVHLGARILRAETAPLAALGHLLMASAGMPPPAASPCS